jgi:hypothetical protein
MSIGDAGGWIRRRAPFALGVAIALPLSLLLGEAYSRLRLPNDIRDYLGGDPSRTGIYKPDPVLGADYRSYEHFHAENAARLAALGGLASARPTWLFLGNSFVQAPDMLAATAQRAMPERRMFYLARNEELPLRVAQARLLLQAGLQPERIFFALVPHDLWQIGRRPLRFIAVNAHGAITTRLRTPEPPWDHLVTESRLAMIAWIRSGRADGDPGFVTRTVADTPSPRVQDDMMSLLRVLAEQSRTFAVPVTVVVIPNRGQILGRAGFGFQAAVRDLCRELGLDYYDAHRPLVEAADKQSLFLPDWHLSARGNALLLDGLLAHLQMTRADAAGPPQAQ